jgi:uncharacterized membrane protein
MVSINKVNSSESYRFVLAPNCSISWSELLLFYLLSCLVALAVGLFFTLQGLWLVLPFSGLEMLALGAGLYLTSRKVYRREVITLDPEHTRIEKGVQRIDQSWDFKTPWIQVIDELPDSGSPRRKLTISMYGESVEVGSFLANSEKDELAFQLKDCIIRV